MLYSVRFFIFNAIFRFVRRQIIFDGKYVHVRHAHRIIRFSNGNRTTRIEYEPEWKKNQIRQIASNFPKGRELHIRLNQNMEIKKF